MQVRAIVEAAMSMSNKGVTVLPEIMVPLVGAPQARFLIFLRLSHQSRITDTIPLPILGFKIQISHHFIDMSFILFTLPLAFDFAIYSFSSDMHLKRVHNSTSLSSNDRDENKMRDLFITL